MILASLVLSALFLGQPPPPSACASDAHRALDFWVGEWDVVTRDGKPSGASRVERILDGCVIMENWSTVGRPYMGKSFNTYNPSDQTWTQHWVDTTGASIVMTGAFEGKNLVYRRDLVSKDGKAARARMTFFNLGADQVRQLVEQSSDEGQTWSTQIDLTYKRKRG
jgi:Protein of unknown function (DUF1579)